jgi:hypothetical protein
MGLSAPLSVLSPNLEQVSEVRGIDDSELDATGPIVEILNAQSFKAMGIPKKSRAPKVDEIVFDPQAARRVIQIRICEIASERGVVVPQRRAEQQRTRTIDHH